MSASNLTTSPDLTAHRLPRLPLRTVLDDRLKTTSFCFAVGYGSRDDPAGRGGIAHLLEHLVMSSPLVSGVSFSEYVERRGGQANAQTGLEVMLYHAQVHADDADEVAALLPRAVLEPVLTEQTLHTERAVVLQELATAAADPSDVVQDAVLAALFPGHPLGRPVGGTAEQLAGVTVTDLIAGHHSALSRAPMAMAVVGPRVPASLVDVPLTVGFAPAAPPVPLGPADTGAVRLQPQVEDFSWLCFGARSPRTGTPGRAAYTVLANLLGASSSSLLYRTLRAEHGLSYAFQAWDHGYREAGAWRLLIGAETSSVGNVTGIVRSLLAQLADPGPSAADFTAASRQAEMNLILEAETPLEHAKLLAERTCSSPLPWTMEGEIAELRQVTAGDVRRAAQDVHRNLLLTIRSAAV